MLTFDLRITVSRRTALTIKHDLTRSMPNIKSSYLTEAIARGLGFNTHASLLSAVAARKDFKQPVYSAVFSQFLRDRGYQVDATRFYLAVARVVIREVMDAHTRLCRAGYGAGQFERKSDGTWESPEEHHTRFLKKREELLSDASAEEFLRSLVFVQLIDPIKSINVKCGSYQLKHRAENLSCNYPDGTPLGPQYVANGPFIIAALHEGFRYRSFRDDLGYDHINVAFNMSQTSLDDIQYALQDSKGLSEARKQRAQRRVLVGMSNYDAHEPSTAQVLAH